MLSKDIVSKYAEKIVLFVENVIWDLWLLKKDLRGDRALITWQLFWNIWLIVLNILEVKLFEPFMQSIDRIEKTFPF